MLMDFLLTVAQNDLETARQLLQTGIDVNCPILWNAKNTFSPVIPATLASNPQQMSKLLSDQEYHSRPLNIAVLGGHVDMVRLLLSAGADINLKDGRGRTALICAIYGLDMDASNIDASNLPLISKTHESHVSIMKNVLLRHPNLYVSTLDSPQYEIKGITPLCLASYLGKSDIIQLLLDDGRVNVDGTDSKNASALMYAARDGNLSIVQMLLNYDASPDITDSHGWSAIQYAEKNPDIVHLCEKALRRKRPDISMIHAPVNPVARYPASYTKLSTLISSLPQHQSSLSHVTFDHTLQDIDLMDPITAPIVHLVQMAFLHAIRSHDHVSLQTLLLWSPPLTLDNTRPSSALLINHHDTKTGLAAIHHAMRAKPIPSLDTLAMLYQAGADVNAQTYYGRTALHHLARIGMDKDGKSWGIQKNPAKQQQQSQPNTNAQPIIPLEEPTTHVGHISPFAGNRLSTVSSTGSDTTTLQDSANHLNPAIKSILAAPTVSAHLGLCASLLVQFGALVNIADPTGNTPLHFASEFGAVPEVLEVLIMDGNADLHLKNKKQQTPLDICKTEDIRRYMLALEKDRKTTHRTKSTLSSNTTATGTIRPFDTASDYRHSLTRSASIQSATIHGDGGKWNAASMTSPASVILPTSISEAAAQNKGLKKKGDVLDEIDADFERILNAFYSYQTTFTDSIEKSLAFITETILQSWQSDDLSTGDEKANPKQGATPGHLERMIVQLRFELREAHDMFDQTDQRAEKIMLHYREALEQVEQIHQADCELLDLQQDKVDKLVDVFERIDSRFCQLEVDQDELIGQVESWRTWSLAHLDRLERQPANTGGAHLHSCIANLMQTLAILTTLPAGDPVLDLRNDRHRLFRELQTVVHQVLHEAHDDGAALQQRWHQVERLLTAPPTAVDTSSSIKSDKNMTPTAAPWQRQLLTASLYSASLKGDGGHRSLNELELSFDILNTNLCEIQKDMDDLQQQSQQVMENKKRMYDVCLALETELASLQHAPGKGDRTEAVVRRELNQVMQCTGTLFDRQSSLDQEGAALKQEQEALEQQLEDTKSALRQVRPPLLLQGLLERLETDDKPMVRVEKDWQEDADLVAVFMDRDSFGDGEESDASSSSSSTRSGGEHKKQQLKSLFKTTLATRCLISRLDASLYCLKVLTAHHISRSRQALLEVQVSLSQAKDEVEEAHNQMITLYTDAAEVARQVYVFKTEVEMIIRHRKEEVVKVWEVVDEVSVGIDTSAVPAADRRPPIAADNDDDNERHQWILRELERFQIVHENLQDAIEDLKREQADIGHRIRQMVTLLIEPQVDRLVGDVSLLSLSDNLADLMDGVRMHDLGLKLDEKHSVTSPERLADLSTNTRLSILSGKSTPSKRVSLALSMHTPSDRKRVSVTSSLSSLSSYQQERMLSRASTLSRALSRHRSTTSRH